MLTKIAHHIELTQSDGLKVFCAI